MAENLRWGDYLTHCSVEYRPVRLQAPVSAAVYLAVTSWGLGYTASLDSWSAWVRFPSQTSPLAYKGHTYSGYASRDRSVNYTHSWCKLLVVYVSQKSWKLVKKQGRATGVDIGIYIPPKSVQVNFLWGKNDVKTAIEQFYTPKNLYSAQNKFLATPVNKLLQ